jgi:beta-lactamase superfamily II metal-dependent hydrolase
MPSRKRSRGELREPQNYFGFVEDIIDADPESGYSRSFLLLDCVAANQFRDREIKALADESALALVRGMSTPKRWREQFGLEGLGKGEWVAFTLDDSGDVPRAWELQADRGYASGPSRSIAAMRRLDPGGGPAASAEDHSLATALTSASAWARSGRNTIAAQDFAARLGAPGDIEIIILDVGQASAALIKRDGEAIGLFDAGAPIWFNKGSAPKNLAPPAISGGFIFLSHWDFDHFDLGRRHPAYRQLDWFAPDQIVGPNTAKFQADLGAKLTFVDGTGQAGGFTFMKGLSTDPKDRNGSGYQLRYDGQGGAVLLTGDANYDLIQSPMLLNLDGVTVPHHAGRGTEPPVPTGMRRAVASYGDPNSYRHPNPGTIVAHESKNWVVIPTARSGTRVRGNRQLFP